MKLAVVALLATSPVAADPLREPARPRPIGLPNSDHEVARRLADELRRPTNPSSPLEYIQLDVDVIESGAPRMRLTRKQVAGLARTWGRLLADPNRRDVSCGMRADGVLCFQVMNGQGPELFLLFCGKGVQPLLLDKIAVVTSRSDLGSDFFRSPCGS